MLVPTGDQHSSVNHPVVELPPAGLIFSIRSVAPRLQPGPSLVAKIELLNILRKFRLPLYAFKEIFKKMYSLVCVLRQPVRIQTLELRQSQGTFP